MVVAPDLGGVKRAREYARLLELPMAFVQKTRVSGEKVEALSLITNRDKAGMRGRDLCVKIHRVGYMAESSYNPHRSPFLCPKSRRS